MKQKVKRRNPMAMDLYSGKYKSKVVRDKTKYTRKTKHKKGGDNPRLKHFKNKLLTCHLG